MELACKERRLTELVPVLRGIPVPEETLATVLTDCSKQLGRHNVQGGHAVCAQLQHSPHRVCVLPSDQVLCNGEGAWRIIDRRVHGLQARVQLGVHACCHHFLWPICRALVRTMIVTRCTKCVAIRHVLFCKFVKQWPRQSPQTVAPSAWRSDACTVFSVGCRSEHFGDSSRTAIQFARRKRRPLERVSKYRGMHFTLRSATDIVALGPSSEFHQGKLNKLRPGCTLFISHDSFRATWPWSF